jgi:recombination protein RecT
MSDLTKTKEKESPSGRFTAMVVKEYQVASGTTTMSPEMKRRIQNYFVKIDMILNDAETKRLSKSEQFRDALDFSWQNINIEKLASEVVVLSSLGLDPLTPNHINPIPFKNTRLNKYDVVFIRGYKGLEVVAKNYALTPPKNVICELVYETDLFDMTKKDRENKVENYAFKVAQPFNRGQIIGGFIYKEFEDETLNTIEVLSIAQILKRKPKHASPEFWGGEKDKWENGKKVGKETIEGWYEEMCLKTLKRHAWGSFTLDGSKVNDSYEKMLDIERDETRVEQSTTTEDAIATVIQPNFEQPKIQQKEVITIKSEQVKEVVAAENPIAFEFPKMD